MSATEVSPAPSTETAPGTAASRPSPAWPRLALACAVLLASGGLRAWQAQRVEARLSAGRHGPRVDLAALPMTLGPWQGRPEALDPRIARATGADQVVTRRYADARTGAAVDLILLYGPAVDMYIHSPEHCYPTAGFSLVAGPEAKVVRADGVEAPFRALVYGRGEGARADLQEVYFSWRYGGRWTPDLGVQKHFERVPSMYKVQLARRVTGSERRDVGNPCEAFLQELLPELGRRLASAGP